MRRAGDGRRAGRLRVVRQIPRGAGRARRLSGRAGRRPGRHQGPGDRRAHRAGDARPADPGPPSRTCWSRTTSRPPTPRCCRGRPWRPSSPSRAGPTSHTAIIARAIGVPAVVACAAATTSPRACGCWSTAPRERYGPADGLRRGPGPERRRRQAGGDRAGQRPRQDPGRRRGAAAGEHGRPRRRRSGAGGRRRGHRPLPHRVPLSRQKAAAAPRRSRRRRTEPRSTPSPAARSWCGRWTRGRTSRWPSCRRPAPEPNPALGERGVRLFRRHPEVMETQLDALATAAAGSAGRAARDGRDGGHGGGGQVVRRRLPGRRPAAARA